MDGLETSQLLCIANHLTSFWLITALTERCFWTEYSKFVMFQKSVLGIHLFRGNCNFLFFFPFQVSCPKRHVRDTSFSFTGAQSFILNDNLVFKDFLCFFSRYIQDLFTEKLCLLLPFFIGVRTERALFLITAFLHVMSRAVWNSKLPSRHTTSRGRPLKVP